MKKQAVLSLSGGMDSSTLLLHLLAHDYEVTALSFFYGQKHRIELEKAQELISYLRSKQLDVKHHILTLGGLPELLNSSLVQGGKDVPEGHYKEENMKETVVPNRNKIFLSLIQATALSIATENKTQVDIALGIHAGDHDVYPDCRQEFRDADMEAFRLGNWESHLVNMFTPYLYSDKFGILEDGEKCCEKLRLDFDEVYKRTNTSYKPLEIKGKWYSDFKSAASIERIEAFIKLGRPDPVNYASVEDGPVTWEHAKEHAEKVLSAYAD